MALVVLDASIVIGQLDAKDAHHAACRKALADHAADELRIPASAYAEALVFPAQRGALAEARDRIAALLIEIGDIGPAVAERAAAIRAGHRMLKMADALVLAYAEEHGAAQVLTTDARWRRASASVHVVS